MATQITAEGTTKRPGGNNIALLATLVIVAAVTVVFALTQSFRLTTLSHLAIQEANLTRVLICFAAGMAFASGGVVHFASDKLIMHVKAYSVLMLALFGLLFGHFLTYPIYLNVIFALISAGLTFIVVNRLLTEGRWQNFWMSALLGIVLIVSMINFLLASAAHDRLGVFALWLLGDLNRLTGNGPATLLSSLAVITWLMLSRQKNLPSLVLLGLGIGAVGPIFFISFLVPHYVLKCSESTKQALTYAALIGGTSLVLVDALPKFIFGGYSPPLVISLTIITIPLLILINRLRLQKMFPSQVRSKVEALIVVFLIITTIFIIAHVGGYALPLI